LPRVVLPDFDYQQAGPERGRQPKRHPRRVGARPSTAEYPAAPGT
jgi:hypothetical protein